MTPLETQRHALFRNRSPSLPGAQAQEIDVAQAHDFQDVRAHTTVKDTNPERVQLTPDLKNVYKPSHLARTAIPRRRQFENNQDSRVIQDNGYILRKRGAQ